MSNQPDQPSSCHDPLAFLTLSRGELLLVRWIGRHPKSDINAIATGVALSLEETQLLLHSLLKQGLLHENKSDVASTYRLMQRKKRTPRKRSKLAEDIWQRL